MKGSQQCFVAGTLIATRDGLLPIEDIQGLVPTTLCRHAPKPTNTGKVYSNQPLFGGKNLTLVSMALLSLTDS